MMAHRAWGWWLLWLTGVQWANYASITGLASAQTVTPTVTLSSSVEQAGRQAACPGEEVTFTCVVIEGAALWWIAEPHITQSDPVTFSVATATAGETRDPTAEIHIVLDDVSRGSVPQVRDFVSTLTVRNSTALSGTVIQCSNGNFITASNTLSITGTPPSSPQNAGSGGVEYSTSDFTVSVQWESPASDGGVGIDSYTLTGAGITAPLTVLSNEPLMATLTLSYNEVHMVSITASNCAGESTASLVTIREVGCGLPPPPLNGSLGDLTSSQEGAVVAFQCNPGLAPSQQMMSVCPASGSWTPDPSELVCMSPPPGDCGVPASPTSGILNYTTTTEGSLATFQCSAGLAPGEVMTAVCEELGGVARWSPDPGDLSCTKPESFPGQGHANTGLSTAEAVGIAIALSAVVSFSAGLLVALVIAYCCSRRQKGQYSPRDTQQPTVTQASTSLQQGSIELKDNISYGPVTSQHPAPQQRAPMYEELGTHEHPGNMEMRANVAYGPIGH